MIDDHSGDPAVVQRCRVPAVSWTKLPIMMVQPPPLFLEHQIKTIIETKTE